MITVFAALSLVATPPAAALKLGPIVGLDQLSKGAPDCRSAFLQAAHDYPLRFQKLGDLPDANLEIAVNRLVGGCPKPLIVSYKVSR